MRRMQQTMKGVMLVAMGLAFAAGTAYAQQPLSTECRQADNGSGTVTLPPAGCAYLSADQVHMIIDGLPVGTTVILEPIHTDFICRKLGMCAVSGSPSTGEGEEFASTGVFQVTGTGLLAGWSRTLTVPLAVMTQTEKRTPGAPVQSFKTQMLRLEGGITGDADFDEFKVVGGKINGLDSPGETTLTLNPATRDYQVKSWFDVGYQIYFKGASGGRLAGYSGTTKGTVRMSAVKPCTEQHPCPCE